MMLPSHAHVECVLNGTRLTEWGVEDPPYSVRKDPTVEVKVAHDGMHYPMTKPNLGGTLTLYLVPHSRDVRWMLDREIERQQCVINKVPHPQFNGTLKDVVSEIDVTLERGYIVQIPSQPVAGQSFMVVFDFQRIVPSAMGKGWSNFGEYPQDDRAPSFGHSIRRES